MVARQAHNLKVGGSIPPSATRIEVEIVGDSLYFFLRLFHVVFGL